MVRYDAIYIDVMRPRAQDLLRRLLDPVPGRRPRVDDLLREESLLNPGMVSSGLALGVKIEGVGVRVARVGADAAGARDAAEATLDKVAAGGSAGGGASEAVAPPPPPPAAVYRGSGEPVVPSTVPAATSGGGDVSVVRALEQLALRLEASNAALKEHLASEKARADASNAALKEHMAASNAMAAQLAKRVETSEARADASNAALKEHMAASNAALKEHWAASSAMAAQLAHRVESSNAALEAALSRYVSVSSLCISCQRVTSGVRVLQAGGSWTWLNVIQRFLCRVSEGSSVARSRVRQHGDAVHVLVAMRAH